MNIRRLFYRQRKRHLLRRVIAKFRENVQRKHAEREEDELKAEEMKEQVQQASDRFKNILKKGGNKTVDTDHGPTQQLDTEQKENINEQKENLKSESHHLQCHNSREVVHSNRDSVEKGQTINSNGSKGESDKSVVLKEKELSMILESETSKLSTVNRRQRPVTDSSAGKRHDFDVTQSSNGQSRNTDTKSNLASSSSSSLPVYLGKSSLQDDMKDTPRYDNNNLYLDTSITDDGLTSNRNQTQECDRSQKYLNQEVTTTINTESRGSIVENIPPKYQLLPNITVNLQDPDVKTSNHFEQRKTNDTCQKAQTDLISHVAHVNASMTPVDEVDDASSTSNIDGFDSDKVEKYSKPNLVRKLKKERQTRMIERSRLLDSETIVRYSRKPYEEIAPMHGQPKKFDFQPPSQKVPHEQGKLIRAERQVELDRKVKIERFFAEVFKPKDDDGRHKKPVSAEEEKKPNKPTLSLAAVFTGLIGAQMGESPRGKQTLKDTFKRLESCQYLRPNRSHDPEFADGKNQVHKVTSWDAAEKSLRTGFGAFNL